MVHEYDQQRRTRCVDETDINFELFAQYLHNPKNRKNILINIGDGIRLRMNGKQIAGGLFGAFIAFLGLLWFLQGTGILHIRPILCVANCEEIVGGSPSWVVFGVITFLIGIIILIMSVRRFGKTPGGSIPE
jgi:hypothetical protein